MFDKHFDFKFKNYQKCGPKDPFLKVHTYTFMAESEPYIVRAEEYKWHTFAVKFYPKCFKDSPNKYSKLTNKGHASRILWTCLLIMIDIFRNHPNASFCFMGTELPTEENRVRTKRFRLYSRLMAEFFDPLKFAHKHYPNQSAYLILNRAYQKEFPDLLSKIENHLFETFDFGDKPSPSSVKSKTKAKD